MSKEDDSSRLYVCGRNLDDQDAYQRQGKTFGLWWVVISDTVLLVAKLLVGK